MPNKITSGDDKGSSGVLKKRDIIIKIIIVINKESNALIIIVYSFLSVRKFKE